MSATKNLNCQDYLKYRFSSAVVNHEPHTTGFEIVANDSMKPSWLGKHFNAEHEEKCLQLYKLIQHSLFYKKNCTQFH